MLPLEEFKLVPGDLVSLYATARDGHSEARTDISFVQVEPFEREFSQSQQIEGNGGGSGGNNQMEISRRQKELIAATWKQQNDKMSSPKEASAAGQFLSDAQRNFAIRSWRFRFACRAVIFPRPTKSSPISTKTCGMRLRRCCLRRKSSDRRSGRMRCNEIGRASCRERV